MVAAAYNVGDLEAFRGYIREHDLRYPILLARPQTLSAFRVDSFPTTYVIDAEGRVVSADTGYAFGFRMRGRLEDAAP